jgi:hypothetical protein
MSGAIEIDDMPNLGTVTDATQFVGEKAGSGLFSATALRTYVYESGSVGRPLEVANTLYVKSDGAANPAVVLTSSTGDAKAQLYWDIVTNSVSLLSPSTTPDGFLQLTGTADFIFGGSGTAYKAGGGSWTAVSDVRIKTVEGDYTPGLTELLQLRPVTYRYRPNCGIAATATSYVGLIAQEVAPVLPDMVHTTNGTIDGQPVTDLMALDVNELQYVLLNAIKELSARIDALEGAAA